MARPSKNKILKAIKGTGAVVSTIAKRLGVEWHTAKRYIELYPETREAYEAEEEAMLDISDIGLYQAVKEREPWAIKWLQSTKGARRGYFTKQNIDITSGGEALELPKVIEYRRASDVKKDDSK